ncbi:MAG: multi-sensor signal transduction histidine kinase [Firmicutes bacterium]|nr:multi-sensor signal transduction histidine kinase [Bacillota bacterium]
MFKWGIRNRLMFSYLSLILITLLLLGAYILHFFYQHTLTSLTSQLLIQSEITEKLLAGQYDQPNTKAALDNTIKTISANTDIRISVIALDGTVIADSWENPGLMENHSTRPELIDAVEKGQGTSIRFSTTLGENLLYVATPIRHNSATIGVLRLATTLTHVNQGFAEIRSALIISFLVASLLAIFISNHIAKRYTAPLESITVTAQEISEGNLSTRVHLHTGDELDVLARTLNNLTANLEEKINEITEEKRKLELILQNTNSSILLLDRYGHMLDYNQAAKDTFSITPDMLRLHNVQIIGNGLFNTAFQQAVETKEKRSIDLKFENNGNRHAFLVSLSPIISSDCQVSAVLAVFHDITALKEIQEHQADFIANASHELATPLTGILGFAETLLDGAIEDQELSTKFVRIIQAEAHRMNRLVKDLLQIAKLDAQNYRINVKTEVLSLDPLVSQAINDLALQWRQKELTLTVEAPPSPLSVLANADWLKQVFINLLDNAVKYTPQSGTIRLSWSQKDKDAVFTITNSGMGIPASDLPRIFDRFYRVERSRTRSTGGTGLGLAIVKYIVEMFNGSIEAKSEVGVSTTFIVRLPLTPGTKI